MNGFWKLIIIGIILFNLFSCQSDNPKEKIEFPVKEFTIKANQDTTLFGKQGTRIFIGSKTFQYSSGKLATDSIKIQLKEFYKKSDIVLAELSTESNGKLLETGGMLNIKAVANEEELEIRSSKRIVVHFPKPKYKFRKMDLFYPDDNSTDTSVTNWNIDTVNLVKRTLKLSSIAFWYPGPDDSTSYKFIPKNFTQKGYYWNPLNFYVKSYNFSKYTIKEIERTLNVNTYPEFDDWNDYGVECEMHISKNGDIEAPIIVTDLSSRARNEILHFLRNLPQLEPGKNKHGEIIQRRGLLFIQSGNLVPLYKTDKEYVKSFDQKYAKFEDKPIKNMDDAELNFYIFSVSKLGWINCDRFREFEEKVDLLANTPVSPDIKLKLVFSNIDGVLKPSIKENQYNFAQVPKNQTATLVGIKNENGRISAAFKTLKITDQPIPNLKFQEMTLSELRSKLDRI